ncbi:MAG: hypothetical protein J0L86_07385 [Flavobacteriales bacterium]|nr:hypothetical protein [Flavobacteriales bacterium]
MYIEIKMRFEVMQEEKHPFFNGKINGKSQWQNQWQKSNSMAKTTNKLLCLLWLIDNEQ